MRYFDRNGRHVPMSFEDRVVSPKWEEIRRLRFVVALAFGAEKGQPIRAAIAGGLIHGLVTDRKTAELLLSAGETSGGQP
jgi:DNA-binding transcriptional regulator LsrR (DeoR family)